jgi:hypothetical protein
LIVPWPRPSELSLAGELHQEGLLVFLESLDELAGSIGGHVDVQVERHPDVVCLKFGQQIPKAHITSLRRDRSPVRRGFFATLPSFPSPDLGWDVSWSQPEPDARKSLAGIGGRYPVLAGLPASGSILIEMLRIVPRPNEIQMPAA